MDNDKRSGSRRSIDELRKELNERQRQTLDELELLGWTLKFVRRPLFLDPVPVVVSDSNDVIGLLDPEGKIVIDTDSSFRTDGDEAELEVALKETVEAESVREPVDGDNWIEKRKGESPVPDNLEDYLNDDQLKALRQIKSFGWQLEFVRRPLFQEPVAVIMNAEMDKLGTLEFDGRIDLKSDFDMRDELAEVSTEEATGAVVDKKLVS